VNGEKLPQSVSIARFVARQLKLNGQTDLESAKCDIVVDTMQDIMESFFRAWHQIQDPEQKKAEQTKFKADIMHQKLQGLEKLVGMYGNGTWVVGNSVTWADLMVYDSLQNLLIADPQVLEKYPKLEKSRKAVGNLPKIAEYLKNRKEKPF
jgi:glutathione S-transferase